MLAVSNTSPLRYLIVVGHAELLAGLFGELLIPPSVAAELADEFTIQLTTEQKADVLIMDERRGRAIAQRRGLPLTGALGVLGDAYRRALIDYPLDVLTDIRQQGFRISDALVARFEALLISRYAR
jgi:predicted nucleic acid-binding protein